MMLANPAMRVALQTTHLPLREVADAITAEALGSTLRIVDPRLRRQFGIASPTHRRARPEPARGRGRPPGPRGTRHHRSRARAPAREGLQLVGPLPADTAFLPGKLRGFDAVLAMYHDQGLPVLKHADFANAVNITLGLPYPRVAVDHGTALDLAGKGMADPSSLFAAIRTCTQFARHRLMHA
jgi:4-hydroxythreonine-4-phosphate dehydrogenase